MLPEDSPLLPKRNNFSFVYGSLLYICAFICFGTTMLYIFSTSPPEVQWDLYFDRHCRKITDSKMGCSPEGLKEASCSISMYRDFPLGPPKHIFAATSRTERSIDTAIPLSVELEIPVEYLDIHAPIEHHLRRIQETGMDPVLLIWEHHQIPLLVEAVIKSCPRLSWNLNPFDDKIDNQLYNVTWVVSTRYRQLRVYEHNYINATCIKHNFTYPYTEYVL